MFSVVSKTLVRTQKQRFFHSSASQLAKLNVEGLAEKVNLEGQNVLMRVDLNVPLSKEVRHETRKRESLSFLRSISLHNI